MKQHYLKGIFFCFALSLTMIACKSKDNDLEVAITAQTLAGRYKLTNLTAETAVSAPQSIMAMLDECELDNIYELKADSTASYIDAGVVCEPAINYELDYEISSNSVSLSGFQNPLFTGGTVKQFDGKTLVLEVKAKGPQTGNIETTVRGTLQKQP